MANIPLQSITFPGLSDKYTTPTVDATLTQTGAAADAKKTGDEIGAIKNDLSEFPNGNYPQMGAGYANQLVSGLKKADQTPYNFRRIPYDATLEDVKKIVGGTTVNNQLLPELKNNNGWAHYNYDTSYTWGNNEVTIIASTEGANGDIQYSDFRTIEGHKYFLRVPFCNASDTVPVYVRVGTSQNYPVNMVGTKDTYVTAERVFVADASARLLFQGNNGTKFKELNLTDLTQDFGTAIADYVYTLETATAGAGVAWLKEHFPKQFDAGYQAYDAGTLKSVEGLSAKKTVGFNQWDEVAELGAIGWSNGIDIDSSTRLRSKNYIPCMPLTRYYVKMQPGVGLNIFFYDYNKNFISYKDASASNSWFDTLENAWYIRFFISNDTYGTTYNHDICINLSDPTKNGTYEPYETHSYALDSDVVLRGIPKLNSNNRLYYDGDEYLPDGTVNRYWAERAYQSGDESDGSTMITDGTKTVYKLATPTTETADPYTTPQFISPDGTEEYVYENGSFELPVGHSSDYPVDVSGQLDDILDTPSANGTYTLKATVADGAVTYSWVADA